MSWICLTNCPVATGMVIVIVTVRQLCWLHFISFLNGTAKGTFGGFYETCAMTS